METVQIVDGLCEPCRHLLQDCYKRKGHRNACYPKAVLKEGELEFETSVNHHPKFAAFCLSAASGCHVCFLLLSQRTINEKQELLRSTSSGSAVMELIDFEAGHPKHGIEAEIRVSYDIYDDLKWERSWLQTMDHNESSVFRNKTMSLQISSTEEITCPLANNRRDSLSKWTLISSWISTCQNGHAKCASAAAKSLPRPSHLIEVGSRTDFSDVRVCKEVPTNGLYITLSHCWGTDGVSFKLLTGNYNACLQSLPWKTLPKTFQDAIEVVRSFPDVQYLWIDALCIVQDSEIDKSREISRMAGIYQGGVCNLAACLGQDCHAGLVNEKKRIPVHECIVEYGITAKDQQRVKISNRNSYDLLVQRSDLSKRAWVLQEVVLAPRVIYFTPEQLIWECAEACYYETTGLVRRQKEFDLRYKLLPIHDLRSVGASSGVWQLYNFWGRYVQDFSGRKLGFESDRLRAIAAIAETIEGQISTSNRYLAGLWSEDLHSHLTWGVDQPSQSSHSDRMKSVLPTWSWASIDTSVKPPYFHADTFRTRRALMSIRPNVEYAAGSSRFDTLAVATLDINGMVFKVDVWTYRNLTRDDAKSKASIWSPKSLGFSGEGRGHRLDSSALLDYQHLEGAEVTSDDYDEEEHFSAYCVFISGYRLAGSFRQHGLVLLRVPNRRGHYYRIGVTTAESSTLEGEKLKHHVLGEDEHVQMLENSHCRITVI